MLPRLFVFAAWLSLAWEAAAAPAFFAMDTGARGGPETVVPLLKELGYSGLGGSPAGERAMAEALEREGMQLFNVYLTLKFEATQPALTDSLRQIIDDLQGHRSALWLSLGGPALPDDVMLERLRELADYAGPKGVRIALYPHTGTPLEHLAYCMALANKLNRPEVGVTFNLCHWLKVEGDRDPEPVLREALPRLMFVTINGADGGETQKLNWDRLIQPLDRGSYDVRGFLQKLAQLGYQGPIGLQGYGIPGDQRENLAHSMAAWRTLHAP